MDTEQFTVIDEDGTEHVFTIYFTFSNEDKNYVLYYDENSEEEPAPVFVSTYDDEGHLYDVESPEELDMVEEVFQSFMAEEEAEEE